MCVCCKRKSLRYWKRKHSPSFLTGRYQSHPASTDRPKNGTKLRKRELRDAATALEPNMPQFSSIVINYSVSPILVLNPNEEHFLSFATEQIPS